jgi:hypothetical protein
VEDLIDRVGYGATSDGTLISTRELLELANQADIIPAVINHCGGRAGLGSDPQNCQHRANAGVDRPRPRLLIPVCRYHHHNFASRGWTCHINPAGLPEWTPPPWLDRQQNPY